MDLKSMALMKNTMLPDSMVKNVGPETEEAVETYPCCLKLYLSKEEMEKLGMSEMPAVETEMNMIAKVEVVAARCENGMSSIELQITDMGLSKLKKESAGHESALYGASEAED